MMSSSLASSSSSSCVNMSPPVSKVYPSSKPLVTMVVHFACLLYTGFVIYTASPGSSLFSWHPTLMVLSFMFFMVQGLLCFSPQSSLIFSSSRRIKTICHWVLMLTSMFLAVFGFLVIYINKENNERPHLKSWHSWFGTAAVVYGLLQCSGGAYLLVLKSYSKISLFKWKLIHATSGLFLFMIVTISLLTGMFTGWFVSEVTGTSWYACMMCPFIFLLVVATQVKNAYLKSSSKQKNKDQGS